MIDGQWRAVWEDLKRAFAGERESIEALFPAVDATPEVVEYTASDGALSPTTTELEGSERTYAIDTDAALSVTLPTPEPDDGTRVTFKDVTGTAPTYNITITATNNIDGDTVVINGARAGATVQSRGPGNGYMLV